MVFILDYKKIYDDFIQDRLTNRQGIVYEVLNVTFKTKLNRSKKLFNGYCEAHHIIPKAYSGEDIVSNIVLLTASDHLFAHALLARIYKGKMLFALLQLTKCNRSSTIINRKIRLHYEYYKSNFVAWNKGCKTSKTQIAKLSLAKSKEVLQFKPDGTFVATYINSLEAEKLTNIKSSLIRMVCNGKRKATGGYLWIRKEDYNGIITDKRNPNKLKKEIK